jgi:ATP-dependent helicase/nuclease subunit B
VFSYARLDLATGRERVKSFFAYEAMPQHGEEPIDTRIGWSAPQDPAQAIDEIEYDLASIHADWHNAGALAWLADTNRHMARSIRARQRRWSREWSDADGMCGDDVHAAQVLARHGLKQRAWSPSDLQLFAQCPYRFHLRGVLGIREVDRPDAPQRIDPRTRGEIYHRVQSEMAGLVTPETLPAALEKLDEVLTRVAAEVAAEVDPALPTVWHAGVEAMRGDLRGWLFYRAHYEAQWEPVATEHKFDVTLAEGWKLAGTIDLIERDTAGHVRVTDYKTGAAPRDKLECTGRGEALQPLLYALAAESLGYDVHSARLAYATIRCNYRLDEIAMGAEARAHASAVLNTIDTWIQKGFLPAAPREKACERCEFVPVCGPYEEERVRCKSAAELRPLHRMREVR